MTASQVFDIVVLGIVALFAWKGASRGLISQAAWVVALILCFKFAGELAPAVEPAIAVDQPLRKWIAMAIVYLGLCLVSFVAAGILNSWVQKSGLKDFDKHLGALLGFIKGVVICMTVMFFGLTLSESSRSTVSASRSAYVAAFIIYHIDPLIPLVPAGAADTVRTVLETFHRNLPQHDELSGGSTSDRDVFLDERNETPPESPDASGGASGFSFGDLFGSGTSESGSSRDSATARGGDVSLQDLLRRIPTEIRQDLTAKTMDTLRNSSAEQKQRLLEELSRSVPADSGSVLDDFVRAFRGQGEGSSGGPQTARLSRANATILDQISGIYGDREKIREKTTQYLAGVPEDIQRRVLEDWHADVMLLRDDPDPQTNVSTRIDERIVRQLKRAGISFERLDFELRNRLSQSNR